MGSGGSLLKIAVLGLWHLGSVTTACLAASGYRVKAWDSDTSLLSRLKKGEPPVQELGLQEAIRKGMASGKIRFCKTSKEAVKNCDVVWIAFDTPVDDHDRALVHVVEKQVLRVLPESKKNALFILSSQLPVLTTWRLEKAAQKQKCPRAFAVIPENLRLGQAMDVFLRPDRVVAGVRNSRSRAIIERIYRPITDKIVFMSVESAEITKHAINGFLATSITFMNEVARICEVTGADAREVEKGLKTESRIGPKAYLRAGSAFAGGTLARDVLYLSQVGRKMKTNPFLLPSIYRSNRYHAKWLQNKICTLFPNLKNRTIGIWGVTYKPGTSTLRRSQSASLVQWLSKRKARVRYHDPEADSLPSLANVQRVSSPLSALQGADALVIGTPWPDYRKISLKKIGQMIKGKPLLDPNGFLEVSGPTAHGFQYHRVGTPRRV
jgi:UDPglucose 6-dehydrogenase